MRVIVSRALETGYALGKGEKWTVEDYEARDNLITRGMYLQVLPIARNW